MPGINLHGAIAEKGVFALVVPLFFVVKGIVAFKPFVGKIKAGFPVARSCVKFFSECQPEIPEALLITTVPADVGFYIFVVRSDFSFCSMTFFCRLPANFSSRLSRR
jgi:hypothetical protein